MNIFSKKIILLISFSILLIPFFSILAEETIEDVENSIENKQTSIEKIKKEIAESKKKIASYQGQEKNLKTEITKLNYQEQQLNKNILEKEVLIEKLHHNINTLENDLKQNIEKQKKHQQNIKNALIFIEDFSNQNPLKILLSQYSISSFFDILYAIHQIQINLTQEIQNLKSIEKEIIKIKDKQEEENQKITSEQELLEDQKTIALNNKQNKNNLLKKTKNQEKYYQKILSEKQKQIKAFYQEIYDLEAKLKIMIDPASLPKARRGYFNWPVPEKNLWITQVYGVTPWRKKYANGTPHNGLDFGVVIGTPMYAISDGVISGTGDNEKVCKGVQYGKWITVDQQDNLSSLYAHLSMIKVKVGQKVKKGELIGYSGNSGYSTGPHLHFAIFATKGLRIQKIKHRYPGRCYGKEMRIPVVAKNAYLNPQNYMPKHSKY